MPTVKWDGKTMNLPYTERGEEKAERMKKKGAKVTYHPPKAKKGKKR